MVELSTLYGATKRLTADIADPSSGLVRDHEGRHIVSLAGCSMMCELVPRGGWCGWTSRQ